MITLNDLCSVLNAVVPMYVPMILAYGSVRWKILSPDQSSGINRFVMIFAIPLLSFHFISTNNPYAMNFRFIAADTLQKTIMLFALAIWTNCTSKGSLEWMLTIFSLSTLPDTLVMGIPVLIAMYGDYSGSLMVQVVVLQRIIWYTLLVFLFEYRAAMLLIMELFPETAALIESFKVDSNVLSLDGGAFLEADTKVGANGKLQVTFRKSNASPRSFMMTPRPSNLTGTEIYGLSSSRNPTPRGSNFNHGDFSSMKGCQARHSNLGAVNSYSDQFTSRGPTPQPSNFEENCATMGQNMSSPFSPAQTVPEAYLAPNLKFSSSLSKSVNNLELQLQQQSQPQPHTQLVQNNTKSSHDAKERHMFVGSSSASPFLEGTGPHVFNSADLGASDQSELSDQGAQEIRMLGADEHLQTEASKGTHHYSVLDYAEELEGEKEGPNGLNVFGSSSTTEPHTKAAAVEEIGNMKQLPPAIVIIRLILIMVRRKLMRDPNTYSCLIGVIWSLIAFGWHVHMPKTIEKSISILSDAGLGMAMFSLGLFMALQPRMIACGNSVATIAMAVRFLTGPAVMAAASFTVGLRGNLLRIAIVQAALPQGIVPFVFAKEYNVHPAILSTSVILGKLIGLPITVVYYIACKISTIQ